MNPPAGTRDEYSRGNGASWHVSDRQREVRRGGSEGRRRPRTGVSGAGRVGRLTFPRAARWAILAGTLIGAVVLVVAEFSTLCTVQVHGAVHLTVPACGRTGSHHHYAMIPIALLVILLGFSALGGGGRYALAAMALVAVVALLIGLLHDLPAAHQSGRALRLNGKYLSAASSPSTGMYLETLGAVIVLATAGLGLLLGQPAPDPGSPWSAD